MAAQADSWTDTGPVFCARCAAELRPGTGNFYQVTIEAVADPAAVVESDESLTAAELRERIEQLLAGMEGVSAQEAMDQVYRRLVLYLCGRCYRQWIENPTG
ncbi:MAG TPA: hypothetical protein VNK04_00570 [Gemmataceae bacterium]|nr:hypothetical protein [Gemmataceae bacterium]